MLISFSYPLLPLNIPAIEESIQMLPFNLQSLREVPNKWRKIVADMIGTTKNITGTAFLTIDGRTISPHETHRRPGPHIDGNYIPEHNSWGQGGGNGWKVGQGGRKLSSEHHNLSYKTISGGMLIVSNYPGCKGWNGHFDAEAGEGGDCSAVNLTGGFVLKSNTVYYSTSQFIHESIPVDRLILRTLIRITLPLTTAYLYV